jgi:hypothetical protein
LCSKVLCSGNVVIQSCWEMLKNKSSAVYSKMVSLIFRDKTVFSLKLCNEKFYVLTLFLSLLKNVDLTNTLTWSCFVYLDLTMFYVWDKLISKFKCEHIDISVHLYQILKFPLRTYASKYLEKHLKVTLFYPWITFMFYVLIRVLTQCFKPTIY